MNRYLLIRTEGEGLEGAAPNQGILRGRGYLIERYRVERGQSYHRGRVERYQTRPYPIRGAVILCMHGICWNSTTSTTDSKHNIPVPHTHPLPAGYRKRRGQADRKHWKRDQGPYGNMGIEPYKDHGNRE